MLNEDGGTSSRDLKERTAEFALRIIKLFGALRKSDVGLVIGRQLLRSGTSVGAQYREACRARSPAEFISKLQCVQQELDETSYWLDLLRRAGEVSLQRLQPLCDEANELQAIFTASVKTAKANRKKRGSDV